MKKNFFLCALCASVFAANATEGALNGKFTINADGDQIVFSQGNLQATTIDLGENWSWSFATNQWDVIGSAAANTSINGNGTVSANGSVDLFGWSTASTYYGINDSKSNSVYSGEFVEWGDNPITNGGNTANMWRTLKKDEWVYLFYGREDAAKLFTMGTVNGVKGTILLPDNWSGDKYDNGLDDEGYYYYNSTGTNFALKSYEGEAWKAMHDKGAVFLPAATYREGAYVYINTQYMNCTYWSASYDDADIAFSLGFNSYILNPQGETYRYTGGSVRLVQDAPKPQTKETTPTTGFLSWSETDQQWWFTVYELDASEEPLFAFVLGADGVKETLPTTLSLANSTDENMIFSDAVNPEEFGGVVKDAEITISYDESGFVEDGIGGYYVLAKLSGEMNDADGNKLIVNEPTDFIKLNISGVTIPTAIESVQPSKGGNQKVLRNGQLFILRDGVLYNAQGAVVE